MQHYISMENKEKLSCGVCGKSYSQKSSLSRHKAKEHGEMAKENGKIHCTEENCDKRSV